MAKYPAEHVIVMTVNMKIRNGDNQDSTRSWIGLLEGQPMKAGPTPIAGGLGILATDNLLRKEASVARAFWDRRPGSRLALHKLYKDFESTCIRSHDLNEVCQGSLRSKLAGAMLCVSRIDADPYANGEIPTYVRDSCEISPLSLGVGEIGNATAAKLPLRGEKRIERLTAETYAKQLNDTAILSRVAKALHGLPALSTSRMLVAIAAAAYLVMERGPVELSRECTAASSAMHHSNGLTTRTGTASS